MSKIYILLGLGVELKITQDATMHYMVEHLDGKAINGYFLEPYYGGTSLEAIFTEMIDDITP
ncbi:MAG: hypothetical protein GY861_03040 [bacterium]|nr:hypothetical protein [bacterium]